MRRSWLPLVLLFAPSCSGAKHASAPKWLTDSDRKECAAGLWREETRLLLVGIDPDIRSRIARKIANGEVVALHLEAQDCNVSVDVLTCTRPTGYEPQSPGPMAGMPSRDEIKLSHIGRSSEIAGRATLLARGDVSPRELHNRSVLVTTVLHDRRAVSWWHDVVDHRVVSRYGPMKKSPAPALVPSDLAGTDCSRVTHWVRGIDYGTFEAKVGPVFEWDSEGKRLDGTSCQDASCAEPLGLDLVTFHPSGCRYGALPHGFCAPIPDHLPEAKAILDRIAPRPCPPRGFAPGQPTEGAAQAMRLFDKAESPHVAARSEEWRQAAFAAARVASSETGDDELNRLIAEYMLAVAWTRLAPDDPKAAEVLRGIALTPCHPRHDEASFFMTALERRRALR